MQKKRLLVIEDDRRIAELICMAADETGFESCTATARMMPPVCRQFRPDMIVLDIVMPEQDGFETLKILSDTCNNTPIVILSGHDNYREMAQQLGDALGVNIIGKIAKPFRKAELCEQLKQMHGKLSEQEVLPLNKSMA